MGSRSASPSWEPPDDGPLLPGMCMWKLLVSPQTTSASTGVSQPAPRSSYWVSDCVLSARALLMPLFEAGHRTLLWGRNRGMG